MKAQKVNWKTYIPMGTKVDKPTYKKIEMPEPSTEDKLTRNTRWVIRVLWLVAIAFTILAIVKYNAM